MKEGVVVLREGGLGPRRHSGHYRLKTSQRQTFVMLLSVSMVYCTAATCVCVSVCVCMCVDMAYYRRSVVLFLPV